MSIIPAVDDAPEGAQPAAGGYWFTPLPVYLLEAVYNPGSPVNAPAAMLWAHIHRNYAWRRRVFPSYAKLAEETGQSESAVKRQLTALKTAGALTWGATYGAKGRSSNEYALAPLRPFDFDRTVQVKNDPHPPVEVKNEPGVQVKNDPYPQVKNDLGVKNTDELENTSSSGLPQPHPVPAPAPTEAAEEPTNTQTSRGAAFLQQLPGRWAAGRKTARDLAPLLLEAAAAQGWQLDDQLAAKLTEDLGPVRTYAGALKHRIEDLPRHSIAVPAPRATRSFADPTYCGLNGCDYGQIEQPDGSYAPCPCTRKVTAA